MLVIAGATGNLGKEITKQLIQKNARIRILVRPESAKEKVSEFRNAGCEIADVDFNDKEELIHACTGASCIISALSGLRNVIIDIQKNLLDAAVAAGVPRFIPSDFSADFTRIPYGTNRNFDLRKEFMEYLDQCDIRATSIFNGMFMDLLLEEAPFIQFSYRKIIFWGNADQLMDFTTIKDTARFTAMAALDDSTPRQLNLAADVLSARGLKSVAEKVTVKKFGLLRVGGLGLLSFMIRAARFFSPAKDEIFPAWQGMQYVRNMLSGDVKLKSMDNERYPNMHWTTIEELLTDYWDTK